MDLSIWNFVLSILLGLVCWTLKEKSAELARVTILMNRTREEMAKEYVTKAEVHADINRILDQLKSMNEKLDRFMEMRSVK
jgi:hypothetical protein